MAVAVSGAGCGSGDGSSVCQRPPASASDPEAAAVLRFAQGQRNLDGTWLAGWQPAVLSVDLSMGSTQPQPGSGTGCGDELLLSADVRVKTRDGLIQAQGSIVRFDSSFQAVVEVPLPGLAEAYARPDPGLVLEDGPPPFIPPGLPSTDAPTLLLSFTANNVGADVMVDRERVVGRWASFPFYLANRRAAPYVVPPELADECAAAADFTDAADQYTPFASADDALAAMPGNWIRCRGAGDQAVGGLQISPDGSWRTLVWRAGAFVAEGGFEQEGILEPPIDLSTYGRVGSYQINLRGPATLRLTNVWGNRLLASEHIAQAGLDSRAVYVRTDRPVTATVVPYAARERAGTAACATAETGTIDPELGSEIESVLAGEWTLCSGELLDGYTTLRFDGRGAVTLVAPDGQALGTRTYETLHPDTVPILSPHYTVMRFQDDTIWTVIFSEQPLKLWLEETSPRTAGRRAVFSPAP